MGNGLSPVPKALEREEGKDMWHLVWTELLLPVILSSIPGHPALRLLSVCLCRLQSHWRELPERCLVLPFLLLLRVIKRNTGFSHLSVQWSLCHFTLNPGWLLRFAVCPLCLLYIVISKSWAESGPPVVEWYLDASMPYQTAVRGTFVTPGKC